MDDVGSEVYNYRTPATLYDVGSLKLYEMEGDIWSPSTENGRNTDNVTAYQSRFKLVSELDIVDKDSSHFTIINDSDHVTFISISAAENLGPAAQLLEAVEAAGDNVDAANWTESCNELLEAVGLGA